MRNKIPEHETEERTDERGDPGWERGFYVLLSFCHTMVVLFLSLLRLFWNRILENLPDSDVFFAKTGPHSRDPTIDFGGDDAGI